MNDLAFVTDDNPVNVVVAAAMLKRLNWQVESFDNARAMLTRLASVHPAVILLDISMPEVDGEEACARIRADFAGAPIRIIAYTAHARHEDRDHFLGHGFDDVLIKPITLGELARSVGEPAPH